MSCDDVYGIFLEKEIIILNRSTRLLMSRAGERLLPKKRISGKMLKRNFDKKTDSEFSVDTQKHSILYLFLHTHALLLFELKVTKFSARLFNIQFHSAPITNSRNQFIWKEK